MEGLTKLQLLLTRFQRQAASEELSGQAQMLKNLVGQFKFVDRGRKTMPVPSDLGASPSVHAASIGGKY